MILDQLGHEGVERTARGRDCLQHLVAALLFDKRLLDRLDLPPDAPDARDEFLFLSDRMHELLLAEIYNTPYGIKSSAIDDAWPIECEKARQRSSWSRKRTQVSARRTPKRL